MDSALSSSVKGYDDFDRMLAAIPRGGKLIRHCIFCFMIFLRE